METYQYSNWQEELLLKRKLANIENNRKRMLRGNNRKRMLRGIYNEQRFVLKRFETKVCINSI